MRKIIILFLAYQLIISILHQKTEAKLYPLAVRLPLVILRINFL
jgi:hypothetical protein